MTSNPINQESKDGSSGTFTNTALNENEGVNQLEDGENVIDVEKDEPESESIKEPYLEMVFDSIERAVDYYKSYGKKTGFPVCRRTSKKLDGKVRYVTIACGRSGKGKKISENILRPYPLTKTTCPARLNIALCNDGSWHVSKIVLQHNHTLSPSKSQIYQCYKVVTPSNSLVAEAQGYDKLQFTEKDLQNHLDGVRPLRLKDGDIMALQTYFRNVQAMDKDFFYSMDLDGDMRLKNLFWADARCRAAYEVFGDVITFDTTYLSNKYNLPLAPFVGMNHHGDYTLLGCGLIYNESVETYSWLFETWLACMGGRAPNAIITDRNIALKSAIEVVFPNARQRWCLWHIMKKIPEKLSGYNQYESIKFSIQNIVYESLTSTEFEDRWSELVAKYKLENDDLLSGLYNERYRWVPCLVKDTFWAGMSVTQKSESMHSFFDHYVNSKTSLSQFVEQYENAMRNKVEKENQEDFESFNSRVSCVTIYPMEKEVQEVYTTSKFREFQDELTGKLYCDICLIESHGACFEYEVFETHFIEEAPKKARFKVCFLKKEVEADCEVKCNCGLFEFRGILCRHAITVLTKHEIYSMPSKYIISRWRKDIKRRHTKVKVTYSDWSETDEGRRFEMMCNAFTEIADMASEVDEKCRFVMNCVRELKEKVVAFDVAQNCRLSSQTSSISKNDETILPLKEVQKISCPAFKRKLSKVEKIVKEQGMAKDKTNSRMMKKRPMDTQIEKQNIEKEVAPPTSHLVQPYNHLVPSYGHLVQLQPYGHRQHVETCSNSDTCWEQEIKATIPKPMQNSGSNE